MGGIAGATRYDQPLHRDALNHTLTVPTSDERFGQVEFFITFSEVTASNGAPQLVSADHTGHSGSNPTGSIVTSVSRTMSSKA